MSCDLDPIPPKLLMECLDFILHYLTVVFISSLVSGIFPQYFKSALVTPIIKRGALMTMIWATMRLSMIYALLL